VLKRIDVRACRRVGERENLGAEGKARLLDVGELRQTGPMGPIGLMGRGPCWAQIAPAPTYKSYRSYSPQITARRVTARTRSPLAFATCLLLLLKRPVHQPPFQEPKNKTDDRVEEELIKVDPKSRGEHRPAILQG
jgi:hypothetical protein